MYVNYVSISKECLVNSGIDKRLKAFPRYFESISINIKTVINNKQNLYLQ